MSIIKYISIAVILLFTLSRCQDHEHEHDQTQDMHIEESGHAHEEDPNFLHMTPEQLERIGVKYGQIIGRNISRQLKVNGRLELPAQNKAKVSSMLGGMVSEIYVRPGDKINKGTRLARLSHFEVVDLQENYLSSTAQIDFLEKELERKESLVEKEIAPEKDLQSTRSKLTELKAKQSASAQKLKMLGIDPAGIDPADLGSSWYVRSPIPGYVRHIHTNTGIFVASQEPLFEIVDNHHIHIDLKAYEKDIPYIREDQQVKFTLQSRPDEVMTARIFAIGKAIEHEERAVTIHAEIDNPDGKLLPGMYVEGQIILNEELVPTLPEEAVTLDKGLEFVFVKTHIHDGEVEFKKVQVKTGIHDLGFVEIIPIDNFPDRPEVVVKGAYFLMAQSKLNQGDAPIHSH